MNADVTSGTTYTYTTSSGTAYSATFVFGNVDANSNSFVIEITYYGSKSAINTMVSLATMVAAMSLIFLTSF